jgi:hypothetical protein
MADERATGGPRWILGWVPRFQADAALAARDASWKEQHARHLAAAWHANRTFPFQQKLLLARGGLRWNTANLADYLDGHSRRSILQAVCAMHRARHQVPPNLCATCAGEDWFVRVLHALAVTPEEARTFLL